jgi:heme acquisition protein HasR
MKFGKNQLARDERPGCGEGSQKVVPTMRHSQIWLAVALLVSVQQALAQSVTPQESTQAQTGNVRTLDEVQVTSVAEEVPQQTNITTGATKEDIERRNASHMTDLIDQVSGTSVNNLYARPEISVGVQGIAGHGRVSQSLEGITQNFHAFTKDIGQTGSIFVEPMFLQSIDVTRGVKNSTGSLGSLGASVDFRYLDLDDILRPGKQFGGMLRGSTGVTKYANGQKPSGSLFLGARTEGWEVMLGASDTENSAYKVGSSFNENDMQRDFHANNLQFYRGLGINITHVGNCRYFGIQGASGSGGYMDGLANCQLTADKVQWLKQAADSGALVGTEKKSTSQMVRVRHFLNDAYDQHLELFATRSKARYQTDQEPNIWTPADDATAYWGERPWSVATELENTVMSLKYKAAVSALINPEVQVYREQQVRMQRWKGIPGSYAVGEDLHYGVDIQSTGIKLGNASHLALPLAGRVRMDVGVEFRQADKEVDSFTEEDANKRRIESLGGTYVAQLWDVNSRNTSQGVTLNLTTENEGPWQASAGIGFQHLNMDILGPRYMTGNQARAGVIQSASVLRAYYRSLGYTTAEARALASADIAAQSNALKIDTADGVTRFIYEDQKHVYNLKSANFNLQYTAPKTGLTTYGALGYSERAPTSNEMYTSGAWARQLFIANPDLEPEKNLSLQLGVNYQRTGWLTASDELKLGASYYHSRLRNQIGYGPLWMRNEIVTDGRSYNSGVANVNNEEVAIRHGFEFNLGYRQPAFYVRGNLTVPLQRNNKICSWTSPSQNWYSQTADADGTYTYTEGGNKGERRCYTGWNWMESSLIEPIRGSFTAALTPMGGKLELGSTVYYRGKQRAAYWYKESVQNPGSQASQEPLPEGDDWIEAYLWPKMIKFDLFANYRINDQLKIGIYAANLTNKMDGSATTMGYNFYPGRTITANLEYRF